MEKRFLYENSKRNMYVGKAWFPWKMKEKYYEKDHLNLFVKSNIHAAFAKEKEEIYGNG